MLWHLAEYGSMQPTDVCSQAMDLLSGAGDDRENGYPMLVVA